MAIVNSSCAEIEYSLVFDELLLESLTTGTFLHDGGLFSVSRLDRERRFWREFFT